jgi:hypothetical protein
VAEAAVIHHDPMYEDQLVAMAKVDEPVQGHLLTRPRWIHP